MDRLRRTVATIKQNDMHGFPISPNTGRQHALLPCRLCNQRPPAMTFRPLPAQAPATLLREAKPLKALFGQAQRLANLQRLVESQLQPAAREHCHVASWREGCLLLIVTDGHWATRLRSQQRRLQRQVQALEALAALPHSRCKVQRPGATRRGPGRTIPRSSTAAQSIQASAEGLSGPKLRAALERLASHPKKTE